MNAAMHCLTRGLLVILAIGSPLAAQTASPAAAAKRSAPAAIHPLDALTTEEYWTIHDVLQQSGHITNKTLFSSVLLHEPDKNAVLAWKPGDALPREADVILEDGGKTVEARVDISGRKLESFTEVPGVQAPITESELDTMNEIVKQDPRVIAALKHHGVSDLSGVRCEPIPITWMIFPEQSSSRIGFGDCTDSHGVYHPWGRAIEGVYILADLTTQKVLKVVDNEPVPMSSSDINYEVGPAVARPGTKPLVVTQPEGPSYTVEGGKGGGEVVWQDWHFHFRLDPRVGAVLNLVRYQDGDRLRSVMYEGALSEMYVPYMDSDEGWNSRAFVDAGEFLLGGLIKPVGPDDCPSNAEYFTGLVPSDKGAPVLRPQLACLFERQGSGPAWRHLEGDVISGRPSRELVLRTAAVAGNYDYLLDWEFHQDGTIRVAVGATGIVETKGVKEETVTMSMADGPGKLEHGTLVAPNLLAVNHDHYFSYRLDLDVDGPNNSFMVDRLVHEPLKGSTRKMIWASQASILHREKDAILDIDLRNPGMWEFINPNQHDARGYPTGWDIMPGATAVSSIPEDDPAQRVGAFSSHQMWVTAYNRDERYAAGTYVTNNPGLRGLPEWIKANRAIENTDIVGWYTLGFHHVVRLEDWPVMPTLWHDFLIRPANFFDQNPTLTLPH
jgi:primary-amine oxidase